MNHKAITVIADIIHSHIYILIVITEVIIIIATLGFPKIRRLHIGNKTHPYVVALDSIIPVLMFQLASYCKLLSSIHDNHDMAVNAPPPPPPVRGCIRS